MPYAYPEGKGKDLGIAGLGFRETQRMICGILICEINDLLDRWSAR